MVARFVRTLDMPLCLALGALMVIALMTLYSAGNESPSIVFAQGSRFVMGLGGMWLMSRLPPTRGLAINLAKRAQGDAGASSVQMVTFEIKD